MPDFNDLIAASKKMSEKMKEAQEALKKIGLIAEGQTIPSIDEILILFSMIGIILYYQEKILLNNRILH